MRRGIGLLAALFLLLASGCAAAQPIHAPYDMNLSIRYRETTDVRRALFDLIYDSIWQGKERIDLPENTAYDDVSAVHELMTREVPELCAASLSWTIWYYENKPGMASGVSVTYFLPVDAQQTLVDTAREIIAGMDAGEGEYPRALALHDLLCERVTYDAAREEAHTAYGALVTGRAVCDGYATAYALLLRLSGIACSVISGQVQNPEQGTWSPHAWNMVELCDTPLLTDVTRDDQKNVVFHWYFNLPEAWMSRDHRAENADGLPESRSIAWNWHIMNGCFVPAGQGRAMVNDALRRIARTGTAVELRFESQTDYLAVTSDIERVWDAYNAAAAPEDRLYGRMKWCVNPQQWCLWLSSAP